MKNKLKKITTLLLVTLCVLFAFGCQPSAPQDIKFTVDISNVESGATVLDYMNYLQDNGELTFVFGSDGMIKSINGVDGSANPYWMLYTDDENNSDSAFGTIEINGVSYYSATHGAGELPAVDGKTYVWRLITYSL